MKIELRIDSQKITADDVLSAIDNIFDYVIKEILPAVLISGFFMTCFCLALGISFFLFLASLILTDNALIRLLGICLSIIFAFYSCKKLYPKI